MQSIANIQMWLVLLLCARLTSSSPTPNDEFGAGLVEIKGPLPGSIEDNTSEGTDATAELFDTLKDLIVESRDAIIDHIDEKIDTLRQDIILNDDNEFVISDDNVDALVEEVGTDDVCFWADRRPVCGEFGECVTSEEQGGFKCLCEHGYTGVTCQLVDHCAEITCQHGGECVNNREGFECDCTDGWYGEHCEMGVE